MRKLAVILISCLLSSAAVWAKSSAQQTSQTARQALIEMFFSKESGSLLKHLPAVTRAALEKAGVMQNLRQYGLLVSQLQTQGKTLQTFETGPVILSTDDSKTGQKTEIAVESDTPEGDQENLQLSIRTYKDGRPQRTPLMPVIVFAMQIESGVWTLNEVGVTMRMSLTDPELLKSITEGVKARAAVPPQLAMQAAGQAAMQRPPSTFGSEGNALTAVRKILAAETTYAATYPAVGFTCNLAELDGFGATEANEHQAMLIDSGLASGRQHGYAFTLSGCTGAPAAAFHLTAAPIGEGFGRRGFCADQSGAIRSSAPENAATCQVSGTPVP